MLDITQPLVRRLSCCALICWKAAVLYLGCCLMACCMLVMIFAYLLSSGFNLLHTNYNHILFVYRPFILSSDLNSVHSDLPELDACLYVSLKERKILFCWMLECVKKWVGPSVRYYWPDA
jgi:hypothetical protein